MRSHVVALLMLAAGLEPCAAASSSPHEVASVNAREGFVTTDDGVRLFFHVAGSGPQVVIAPLALYLLPEFDRLADGHTLVYYDPRNRGRSDPVQDPAKLKGAMHREVDDLEAVRRHLTDSSISMCWSKN
jgi:proline iminopeptidase